MSGLVPYWVPVVTAVAGIGGALASQYLSHHYTAKREKKSEEKKLASDRAYIGGQLLILVAGYRKQCEKFAQTPVKRNVAPARPVSPDFSSVKGEWTALSVSLLEKIPSISFIRNQYESHLEEMFELFGSGDEYCDEATEIYQGIVSECDLIIDELRTLCGLTTPTEHSMNNPLSEKKMS